MLPCPARAPAAVHQGIIGKPLENQWFSDDSLVAAAAGLPRWEAARTVQKPCKTLQKPDCRVNRLPYSLLFRRPQRPWRAQDAAPASPLRPRRPTRKSSENHWETNGFPKSPWWAAKGARAGQGSIVDPRWEAANHAKYLNTRK